MKLIQLFAVLSLLLSSSPETFGQHKTNGNLVYVDKNGVLRFTKDNKEASFFGVNYTAPFAYSYRAQKALGVDMEKAIQQDVYQMARLGLDAFRVHVWDTEISDTAGNLLTNEHLRLFDFLIAELRKRNMKVVITAIAFGGNGYPQRDEVTPGFARKYGKAKAAIDDGAIAAQVNYLRQFFKHVNPYTNLTYTDDPNVIAVELNNEPGHSGPKEAVTGYINRLVVAMKSIGWTKPLYYNIAQNRFYASSVAKANIDGVSFQWYPTGLVANGEVKGNFLANVDHYTIPFDTIPEYRNKARMVYEFDAADVLQSCLYPAMARSFRQAGFQWATQFAYDPTALAYANTEYQTHYLNLLYTPSKAISLLIASKVFHKLPRLISFGSYPVDSSFDVFRVSYKNSLSEMNSPEEFYYSNSTNTKPSDITRLKHIAGVGSSSVIKYEGVGAYFLDKIEKGVWRLEVYPDAVHVRDPFEKASPKKEVTRLQWQSNLMQILLPGLGSSISIRGINDGNKFFLITSSGELKISPGTYLVTSADIRSTNPITQDIISLNEFGVTKTQQGDMYLRHEPLKEVSSGKGFTISANIVDLDAGRATVQISKPGGSSQLIPMIRKSSVQYSANVPADFATPGIINYRIILQKENEFFVFPGDHKENPFEWDSYNNDFWHTFAVPSNAKLQLFTPEINKSTWIYPTPGRDLQSSYITGVEPGKLILKIRTEQSSGNPTIGLVHFFGDDIRGRESEMDSFEKLIIRARSGESMEEGKLTLITMDGFAFSAPFRLTNEFENIEIRLDQLEPDSLLLLPRPYPGFLPLWFKGSGTSSFHLSQAEKIQVTVNVPERTSGLKQPCALEIESIWLEKKNKY